MTVVEAVVENGRSLQRWHCKEGQSKERLRNYDLLAYMLSSQSFGPNKENLNRYAENMSSVIV